MSEYATLDGFSGMGGDADDTAEGAYGRTPQRLQEVKAVYDPHNVFRLNQNIQPAPVPS